MALSDSMRAPVRMSPFGPLPGEADHFFSASSSVAGSPGRRREACSERSERACYDVAWSTCNVAGCSHLQMYNLRDLGSIMSY